MTDLFRNYTKQCRSSWRIMCMNVMSDVEWKTDIWHVKFFQSKLGPLLICTFWEELELITVILNGDKAPLGSINVRELNLIAYLSFILHPYLHFFTSVVVLENNLGGEVESSCLVQGVQVLYSMPCRNAMPTQRQRMRKSLRYLMPSLPQSLVVRPACSWGIQPPELKYRDREQNEAPIIQQ